MHQVSAGHTFMPVYPGVLISPFHALTTILAKKRRKLVLTPVFDNWNFCQFSRIPSRSTYVDEVYLQGDSMHLSKRATAEFLGTFCWFSAGVEVQYLLQLFPNWVSVSMAWPLPLA